MMTILGIDPGLATTGYGIVVKNAGAAPLQALEWGIIETKKNSPLPERLLAISADLEKLVSLHQPALAVVESLYFAKNTKTAMTVAQARGAILLTLARRKVTILELTPLQLKLSIASYGAASKAQVQTMVKKLLGLRTLPQPDDAADALALAVCGSIKQL